MTSYDSSFVDGMVLVSWPATVTPTVSRRKGITRRGECEVRRCFGDPRLRLSEARVRQVCVRERWGDVSCPLNLCVRYTAHDVNGGRERENLTAPNFESILPSHTKVHAAKMSERRKA